MKDIITYKNIIRILNEKGYVFFDDNKPYNLNIIGVRMNTNEVNYFDDYLTVIYRDNNLEKHMKLWSITTDPGKYWLEHPINTKGTAILVPGQYRSSYQIGKHQGKYTALCQRKTVNVYRDNDLDNELDFNPATIENGMFGINIHRSDPYTESYLVNKWSAGCQVFKRVEDFNSFMRLVQMSKELYGNSFTYTLLTEKDF